MFLGNLYFLLQLNVVNLNTLLIATNILKYLNQILIFNVICKLNVEIEIDFLNQRNPIQLIYFLLIDLEYLKHTLSDHFIHFINLSMLYIHHFDRQPPRIRLLIGLMNAHQIKVINELVLIRFSIR